MQITIKNITEFCNFLSAAVKISDGHKFIINRNNIIIRSVNSDKTIRAELQFNLIEADTPFTFCMMETSRFLNTLKMCIPAKNEVLALTLVYDGEMITHNSKKFKFKFGTASPAVVNKWVDENIDLSKFTMTASADVKSDDLKRIITAYGIINSESAKVYLSKQDEIIMADVTDSATRLSNAITIPLTESYDGMWVTPYCCKFASFRMFNIYGLDSITLTVYNSAAINAKSGNDAYTASLNCSLIKG